MTERTVTCCIVGGGPAGMMLGYLLARAGVEVLVLEKHADFLRDFRGDTIHPSTLEVMKELGLLDEFLALPHEKVGVLGGQIGETSLLIADFTHLPVHCPFIALMPQWDFLNFLAAKGQSLPSFHLMMQAKAEGLIEENGRIVGVNAATTEGPLSIRANLVVGADGRRSDIRLAAQLQVEDLGAPMDVLWFRLSRQADDPEQTFGHIDAGRMFIMLNRGDYWQCAFVIPKGGFANVKTAGLEAFRKGLLELSPFLGARTEEVTDWSDVKLLTVAVDRMPVWFRPGLLCIGDAAHAMSPIGGVGVNLAIQDAVATANILAAPLRENRLTDADLAAVQKRREWPARVTQRLQIFLQNRVISPVLASKGVLKAPLPVRLLARFPLLRRIPARMIGMGVRPEHVRTQPAQKV